RGVRGPRRPRPGVQLARSRPGRTVVPAAVPAQRPPLHQPSRRPAVCRARLPGGRIGNQGGHRGPPSWCEGGRVAQERGSRKDSRKKRKHVSLKKAVKALETLLEELDKLPVEAEPASSEQQTVE